MGFYQFIRKQDLPCEMSELWRFICDPSNLEKITPSEMGFKIISENLPTKMYAGQIIEYRVSPILNIKTRWVTEITHVDEGRYFVDEQRIGPYAMWHHEHILSKGKLGTLMTDIVSYQPPFGVFGSLANAVFIKHKLAEIFNHREKVLEEKFQR